MRSSGSIISEATGGMIARAMHRALASAALALLVAQLGDARQQSAARELDASSPTSRSTQDRRFGPRTWRR